MRVPTARYVPTVEDGVLFLDPHSRHERSGVIVGSEAWFAWLATARSFIYQGRASHFTARARQRKGSNYWYALRRQRGRLEELYLGREQNITLQRLEEVAIRLNQQAAWESRSNEESMVHQPAQSLVEKRDSPYLIETKFHSPRIRPSRLVRTHAQERLRQITDYPLTVVSAPAGYGKTTLLARWIADSRLQVAWVSLDEGDNDLTRFWTYVCAALDRLEPGLFDTMRPLLRAPNVQESGAVVKALVEALSRAVEPTILVLDDYHVLSEANEILHKEMTTFIDRLPPSVHLVLTSRGDPSLPLSRLRAHQRIFQLHEGDLRFSLEEARTFLMECMELNLSAQDVKRLNDYTEGWVTGLQLAALVAQKSTDIAAWVAGTSGVSQHISDYLIREVLARQPSDLQAFMLAVAPLDQLTAPLCDAVTQSNDSQSKLEALERAGFFLVPLDERHIWYRFHQLFASALLQHAQKVHPDRIRAACARASAWCEANRLWTPAINYALNARDFDRAARLLEKHAQEMFIPDYPTLLRDKLDRLPGALMRMRPRLAMLYAYTSFLNGDYPVFRERLREAGESFTRRASRLSSDERRLLRGELIALYMDVCRQLGTHLRPSDVRGAPLMSRDKRGVGRLPLGVTMSRQTLRALPPDHPFRDLVLGNLAAGYVMDGEVWEAGRLLEDVLRASEARGDVYFTSQAAQLAGYVRLQQGRLDDAVALCRRPDDLLEFYGDHSIGSGRLAVLGAVAYLRNDLETAGQLLNADLSLRHDLIFMLLIALPARAYTQLAQNKMDEAFATMESALTIQARAEAEKQRTSPWLTRYLRAHQACLWLFAGNVKAAAGWARRVESYSDTKGHGSPHPPVLISEWEQLVLARAYLSMGRSQDALMLLERLRAQTEASGRTTRLLEILALEAVGFASVGAIPSTLHVLQRAVELGAQDGFVRPFVNEGPTVQRLLAMLSADRSLLREKSRRVNSHSLQTYVDSLLSAFRSAQPDEDQSASSYLPTSSGSRHRAAGAVAKLTPREVQVIQLVAQGASNREVANRLVITVSTIKRHLNNIFIKLRAHSRTQAVARARELHVFDSEEDSGEY